MEQGYRIECSEHPEVTEVIDAPVGDVQGIAESHGLRFHGDAFAPCITVTHTSETRNSRDFAALEVRNYELLARNGRRIRTATMVMFSDGREMRFTERMSKREAIRQAQVQPHTFDVRECPCSECQR